MGRTVRIRITSTCGSAAFHQDNFVQFSFGDDIWVPPTPKKYAGDDPNSNVDTVMRDLASGIRQRAGGVARVVSGPSPEGTDQGTRATRVLEIDCEDEIDFGVNGTDPLNNEGKCQLRAEVEVEEGEEEFTVKHVPPRLIIKYASASAWPWTPHGLLEQITKSGFTYYFHKFPPGKGGIVKWKGTGPGSKRVEPLPPPRSPETPPEEVGPSGPESPEEVPPERRPEGGGPGENESPDPGPREGTGPSPKPKIPKTPLPFDPGPLPMPPMPEPLDDPFAEPEEPEEEHLDPGPIDVPDLPLPPVKIPLPPIEEPLKIPVEKGETEGGSTPKKAGETTGETPEDEPAPERESGEKR